MVEGPGGDDAHPAADAGGSSDRTSTGNLAQRGTDANLTSVSAKKSPDDIAASQYLQAVLRAFRKSMRYACAAARRALDRGLGLFGGVRRTRTRRRGTVIQARGGFSDDGQSMGRGDFAVLPVLAAIGESIRGKGIQRAAAAQGNVSSGVFVPVSSAGKNPGGGIREGASAGSY